MNFQNFLSLNCLLTISFPKRLKPEITDHLRQMTDDIDGFTVVNASGFGHQQSFLTALEKVQGSTDRCLLMVIIEYEKIETVLTTLKKQYERVDMYYWVTPVTHQGYF